MADEHQGAVRIKVINPVVDLDGDEMTRIIWQSIKEDLIRPYLDIDLKYFDLGLKNRDMTDDAVTTAAIEAIKQYAVAVKCPTISVDSGRVKEYNLKKAWYSANGAIRSAFGGTLFREPIVVPSLPKPIPGWKYPIVVARHAFGDMYVAKDAYFDEEGTLSLVFRPKQGATQEIKIADLPSTGSVALAQYNTNDSINSFAHATFRLARDRKLPVIFCHKASILNRYDERFKVVLRTVYDQHYEADFTRLGLSYEDKTIDDLVAYMFKIPGNIVVAMKNYDGDVFSDQVAQAFGSLGMMTSELVSNDGTVFVSEASHGTVTKHYYAYLQGERISTNPTSCIFAWTRALMRRGMLDDTTELVSWAETLEKSVVDTIEKDRIMTKDLAFAWGKPKPEDYVTTDAFISAVDTRLRKELYG